MEVLVYWYCSVSVRYINFYILFTAESVARFRNVRVLQSPSPLEIGRRARFCVAGCTGDLSCREEGGGIDTTFHVCAHSETNQKAGLRPRRKASLFPAFLHSSERNSTVRTVPFLMMKRYHVFVHS